LAVQPSDEELIGHHLVYEIDMLRETIFRIGRSGDKVLNNALIESFCVHARNLIEFFQKPRGAGRYVRPGYKAFDNVDISPDIKRLNNQISHLLDGRTADNSGKIDGRERARLYELIAHEIRTFKGTLKDEYSSIEIPELLPLTVSITSTTTTSSAPMSTSSISFSSADLTGVGSTRPGR
jgi:hypothetical protein